VRAASRASVPGIEPIAVAVPGGQGGRSVTGDVYQGLAGTT
jgi:hypothetical protein